MVFLDCLRRYVFYDVEEFLNPLFPRYVIFSLNVAIVEVSVRSFTEVTNIAFYDQSYSKNISVFTSLDIIGIFPV